MKVHHLNCGTMCPLGGKLVSGKGGFFSPASMVCHCLLIETEAGLVLVDTGIGSGDVRNRGKDLGAAFRVVTRPKLTFEETALHHVGKLGFKPEDVRHIVPTHLDLDHAGGLPDFPKATVHTFQAEYAAVQARATLKEKSRYIPAHFAHQPTWEIYEEQGEPWFRFPTVSNLKGLPPEILLVPLPGHTRGLCGVAVDTGEGWLLHAGDAFFSMGELHQPSRCPLGLRLFQGLGQMDGEKRRANQERLRVLHREQGGKVRIFCAHDPAAFPG